MMPDAELQKTFDLAARHHRAGQLLEAEALYRRILAANPNHADTIRMIGLLALDLGRADAAITLLERAIKINPAVPDYHSDLARAFRASGRLDDAILAYKRAIKLRPDAAETLNDLGNALLEARRGSEAVDAFERAIFLKPDFPEASNNLGNAMSKLGDVDGAIASYRQAIRLRPDLAEVHANLAAALKETGQLDEALDLYRRAEELKPDARIAGARFYAIHLHPDYGPEQILQEHLDWNLRYSAPLASSIRPHVNQTSPDRRLRVGYVSGDFSDHPVSRFLLPLLMNHDREQVEVFCYSDTRRQDATTARLRAAAAHWRLTLAHSDEQLADLIRQDRIDVLVDLSMHAAGSRLLAFARKPAPVQLTWLAYCSTTGLQTMDYRLTDPYLDPPGTDPFYSERSIRLPETFWCYAPPAEAPAVKTDRATSEVVFACLNSFAKVSPPALALWIEILRRVDDSRLVLHCAQGAHRHRVAARFAAQGIASDRINFVERIPLADYFALHNQIDIALDPLPFAGATTTCDALWMGVPLVTLAGRTGVGRAGVSILSNVGLPELVAQSRDQYVSIATRLAQDPQARHDIRASLRQRMLTSPLMDAPRFACNIQAAFRQMWRAYCVASSC